MRWRRRRRARGTGRASSKAPGKDVAITGRPGDGPEARLGGLDGDAGAGRQGHTAERHHGAGGRGPLSHVRRRGKPGIRWQEATGGAAISGQVSGAGEFSTAFELKRTGEGLYFRRRKRARRCRRISWGLGKECWAAAIASFAWSETRARRGRHRRRHGGERRRAQPGDSDYHHHAERGPVRIRILRYRRVLLRPPGRQRRDYGALDAGRDHDAADIPAGQEVEMDLAVFDFHLPEDLIAQKRSPTARRRACWWFIASRAVGKTGGFASCRNSCNRAIAWCSTTHASFRHACSAIAPACTRWRWGRIIPNSANT